MKNKKRFLVSALTGLVLSMGLVSSASALGPGTYIIGGAIFSCGAPTPTSSGLSNCHFIGWVDAHAQ